MDLHTTSDVETYAAAVVGFLEAEPCARNVPRSIIELARHGAGGWDAAPLFLWVTDAGAVAGAASWTPPHAILATEFPDEMAAALVDAVRAHAVAVALPVRGVSAPADAAASIAAAWTATGEPSTRNMRETLYELREVRPVPRPPGARRLATLGDVELTAEWLQAFSAEIGVPAVSDPRASMRHMVEAGSCSVWVDAGAVVSMAGHRRPLAGVTRVGPVYTPPRRRGRGYARRLVAEASRAALAAGAERCMLFADAANPVSNSIYLQIGYEAREERVDIVFIPSGSASELRAGGAIRQGSGP